MPTDLMFLLAGFAARAALVLAAAWVLTLVMRRASASARHLVWTCAIAAAALMPATALVVPQWQVTSAAALAPIRVAVTTALAPVPAVSTAAPAPRSAEDASRSTTAIAGSRGSLSYMDFALMVWALGTTALLLYVAVGCLSAWRLRRCAPHEHSASLDDVQALAEAFRIAQPIAVVHTDAVTLPMVSGIWRPAIVLPRSAADWPEERRHVVLLHELAHVKRRDCLTQLLAQIVCAAYWFNPLVWVAAGRLRAERERACDDFVLAAGTRGSDYANHLLEIAQALQPRRFSPVAATALAMARQSQLEGRLMAILDPAIRRSSALPTRFAAAALIVLVSIPVAAVHLASPSEDAPPSREQSSSPPAVTRSPLAAPTAAVADAAPPNRPSQSAQSEQTARGVPQDERLRRTLNRTLVELAGDGDLDGVTAMLAAGADVNAQIDGDGTPLIAAAGDGHADVVRLLLDRGADPNLIVPGDGTALIAAAGEGHTDVVELLLQRGAQVNLVAEGDETALIQASGDGHLDVVKLLVSRGADVNLGVMVEEAIWAGNARRGRIAETRRELRTPLSEARQDGHVDVVRFLISAGARD